MTKIVRWDDTEDDVKFDEWSKTSVAETQKLSDTTCDTDREITIKDYIQVTSAQMTVISEELSKLYLFLFGEDLRGGDLKVINDPKCMGEEVYNQTKMAASLAQAVRAICKKIGAAGI